jgi:hypothetical protein
MTRDRPAVHFERTNSNRKKMITQRAMNPGCRWLYCSDRNHTYRETKGRMKSTRFSSGTCFQAFTNHASGFERLSWGCNSSIIMSCGKVSQETECAVVTLPFPQFAIANHGPAEFTRRFSCLNNANRSPSRPIPRGVLPPLARRNNQTRRRGNSSNFATADSGTMEFHQPHRMVE